MRVTHVVNSDLRGGAARAAFNLHIALRKKNIDSRLLVQRKFSDEKNIYGFNNSFVSKNLTNFRMMMDLLKIKNYTKENLGRFSFGDVGLDISNHDFIKQSDVIHLHWINEGFLSLRSLEKLFQLKKNIVWTFHDMWAFTGGCHYSGKCKSYENTCSICPYLKKPADDDYSFKFFELKKKIYSSSKFKIITCSNWLKSCVKSSTLLKEKIVEVIPNTIDTNRFNAIDKYEARKKLQLESDKIYFLFTTLSTNEQRKGLSQLIETLKFFKNNYSIPEKKYEIIVIGKHYEKNDFDFSFPVRYTGRINDDTVLADYYSSADIFIAPSLQDNLPNTVMESLACGTPVAAFNIGGMPDMIIHKENGFLAREESHEDLALGIKYLLDADTKSLSTNARKKVLENYSNDLIAQKHIEYYSRD
ncbi:MAG: glycosyl transferase family 1 [Chlorobiaceae bacterium]|nr:glycosyl transferase family 1 [Chlorobiaceae bacterium]